MELIVLQINEISKTECYTFQLKTSFLLVKVLFLGQADLTF